MRGPQIRGGYVTHSIRNISQKDYRECEAIVSGSFGGGIHQTRLHHKFDVHR